MTHKEMYKLIKKTSYKTVGLDVNYKIIVDDNEKCVYIVFQESVSKQDWKINFDFPAKVYKNQESPLIVHRGYAKAWKSARDVILAEFEDEFINKIHYDVYVIGWSYGSSIALLCAEDIKYWYNVSCNVVTFGGAKICYGLRSRNYLRKCYESCFQYTNINDFVTWMIPLPFVYNVRKIRVGGRFKFKEILNTVYNHTHYDKFMN